MKKIVAPLIPLIIIYYSLEYLVQHGFIPTYLIPPPSEVLQSLVDDRLEYWEAARSTVTAAVLGLILSAVVGVLFALFISFSRILELAFYPYAVFFQTVPLISIAPILVIWFGFGIPTVVASAVIASVFPVIANTLAGMWSTDKSLLDLFSLYGAKRWQVLFKLRFPNAIPHIFTGLRISSGLSMIGAIVGEFIAGGGLGGLVDAARNQQRLDKVFAAALIASFAGIFVIAALNFIAILFVRRWNLKH